MVCPPSHMVGGKKANVLVSLHWSRLCPNPAPTLTPSQEVFYLTYTSDDIEGNMHLDTGDKVSFYMETNKQ